MTEKMAKKPLEQAKADIRWSVFAPGIIVFAVAAVVGVVDNESLTSVSQSFFNWSLDTFGWLYQFVALGGLLLAGIITFSKLGNIRFGGKEARPNFSFASWFAMALTGGIAVGIVTWSVNEPLIYFGNVWGEMDQSGIQPFTAEAARFAIGRTYYHWTFIPYAMYAICGILTAYVYFNKKEPLTVTSTLKPLFGRRLAHGPTASVVDTLAMLALGLGITSGLTMCITLVVTGLRGYGVESSLPLFVGIGALIILLFTISSYVGLNRGLKILGNINAWFYYGLIILFIVAGPLLFILRNSTAGLAVWLDNFFLWGLDPIDIYGPALTRSWTLFCWACWIAYAPVTAIFLAIIAYGRTIREFMLVNFVLPSIFGFIWFSVWGNTALNMQITGAVDLVGAINEGGAVMALWEFLRNMPLGLGPIIVPINILVIVISYVTAADATLTNIGSMCIKEVPIGTEPPAKIKMTWGLFIGSIAIVMAAFGGGAQGVDGYKALAVAGGFVVLFIFCLQIMSAIKAFFIDELVE